MILSTPTRYSYTHQVHLHPRGEGTPTRYHTVAPTRYTYTFKELLLYTTSDLTRICQQELRVCYEFFFISHSRIRIRSGIIVKGRFRFRIKMVEIRSVPDPNKKWPGSALFRIRIKNGRDPQCFGSE
jgi:hypothetical protein